MVGDAADTTNLPEHLGEVGWEATVRALGLRRIRQSASHEDSVSVRGMIAKVPHVLKVTREA